MNMGESAGAGIAGHIHMHVLARWYGEALATGLTVADVEAWPARMEAVTTDAVAAAARQWLDKRRAVTGFLLPA